LSHEQTYSLDEVERRDMDATCEGENDTCYLRHGGRWFLVDRRTGTTVLVTNRRKLPMGPWIRSEEREEGT
jgi:hypothetical protein